MEDLSSNLKSDSKNCARILAETIGNVEEDAVLEEKGSAYLSPLKFRLPQIFAPFNFRPFNFRPLPTYGSLPLIFAPLKRKLKAGKFGGSIANFSLFSFKKIKKTFFSLRNMSRDHSLYN